MSLPRATEASRLHAGFILFLTVTTVLSVWAHRRNFDRVVIRSDGVLYYEYLPALLRYGDPWLERLGERRPDYAAPEDPALFRLENGRRLIKYPPGCALAWLPFYLAAEGATKVFGLDADPYGPVHQAAVCVAATTYLILGLVVLYAISVRRHPPLSVTAALAGLVFGTNLFHYSTFDASFSHVYSFCAVSLWVLALSRLLEAPSRAAGFIFGLALGMVFLIRNTNVLVLFFTAPVLWGHGTKRREFLRAALWAALGFGLPASLQTLYGLAGAGDWFFLGYRLKGEGFVNWLAPRIFYVLFSPQRGFFFWAPLMLAPLMLTLRGALRDREAFLYRGILLVLAAQALLVGSWWAPSYGGSFGHRAFVDVLPLLFLAFPPAIAVALGWRPWPRAAAVLLMVASVMYTWKLMIAYWIGRLSVGEPTLRQWARALCRNVWW